MSKEKVGYNYGKSDLSRIGLFSEQRYISVGESYVSKKSASSLDYRANGKQFLTAPPKRGHDSKESYFGQNFVRLFENEPYTDLVALRRKWRNQEKLKNITKQPFKPSSVPPKPSGKGSHWGTLEQQWPTKNPKLELAPRPERKEKKSPELKNFVTSPAKKGSGYSYTNVTIGKQYEYKSDPYDNAILTERSERKEHRKKMVGARPFISSSSTHDFFNNFAGLVKIDKELPPVEKKLNPIPFKPTGTHGTTINPYPTYEPPKGEAKPPPPPARTYIFKPSGVTGSYPMRSIIDSNIPLAPELWIQNALTESLKI